MKKLPEAEKRGMRVVLDTNVLVSGVLSPFNAPGRILDLVLIERLRLILDERILFEYSDVLQRPKFGFDEQLVHHLLSFIKTSGLVVVPDTYKELSSTHADDRKFCEVALSGDAQFLITGNLRHFPKTSWIVSPAKFMALWSELQ